MDCMRNPAATPTDKRHWSLGTASEITHTKINRQAAMLKPERERDGAKLAHVWLRLELAATDNISIGQPHGIEGDRGAKIVVVDQI